MSKVKYLSLLGLIVCTLAGCGPVSGISGSVFFSRNSPDLSVAPAPDAGMRHMASGGLLCNTDTNTNMQVPVYLDYAIFGDSGAGLVKRHGHVLVADISSNVWEFMYESNGGKYVAKMRDIEKPGLGFWVEQLRYELSDKDWLSAYWQANGRVVPETWLVKRWYSVETGPVKTAVEYREPMPACVSIGESMGQAPHYAIFNTPDAQCALALTAFEERAEKAFVFGRGNVPEQPEFPAALVHKPAGRPDLEHLVGRLQARDLLMDW